MDDNVLIDRFLAGDKTGFEMLVEKYKNNIVNIVYSLTSQTQNADDIAQEVFIKVYQNLANFKKTARFSSWLYRITVNTTYNYIKKQSRLLPLEYLRPEQSREQETTAILENKERQALLKQALSKLPFKFRSVVVLKELEGLSYQNIAQVLGCRIGTVESRLFRARQMLKKTLAPLIKEAGHEL